MAVYDMQSHQLPIQNEIKVTQGLKGDTTMPVIVSVIATVFKYAAFCVIIVFAYAIGVSAGRESTKREHETAICMEHTHGGED